MQGCAYQRRGLDLGDVMGLMVIRERSLGPCAQRRLASQHSRLTQLHTRHFTFPTMASPSTTRDGDIEAQRDVLQSHGAPYDLTLESANDSRNRAGRKRDS